MDLDRDMRLRLAVFDHLGRLRREGGGVVTSHALNQGIDFEGERRIHLRDGVLEEVDGPMLRHGLQELPGGVIQVPRRVRDRPNRDDLAERFERFRAA